MSVNRWAKHYQSAWHERTGDSSLPLWLRVACLAYGSHRANGHARFAPGAVALALSAVDEATGEIRTPDKSNVQRAIRAAVRNGWLAQGSGTTCLVVPAHAISGGLGGSEWDPCPIHEGKWARRRAA